MTVLRSLSSRPGTFKRRGAFFSTAQVIETLREFDVLNIFFHRCLREASICRYCLRLASSNMRFSTDVDKTVR